jgi:hypothetical protein
MDLPWQLGNICRAVFNRLVVVSGSPLDLLAPNAYSGFHRMEDKLTGLFSHEKAQKAQEYAVFAPSALFRGQ